MTKITFLGTGTSHGVPVIGCSCPVCRSENPKDKRYRSSILVEKNGSAAVIDTGCEFRLQALRAGMTKLDGVLLTHAHADHLMGLDDTRVFTFDERLHIYGFQSVLDIVVNAFGYAFREWGYKGVPRLEATAVEEYVPFKVGELEFLPIPVMHGNMRIAGYRFGAAAYITDVSDLLLDENMKYLSSLDILIIGALRSKPHWSHFSFAQAAENAVRTGARRIFFTHINHETAHDAISREFQGVAEPAYDTLVLETDDE